MTEPPQNPDQSHETDRDRQHDVGADVRSSFARCINENEEFFDDFYATLADNVPGVGAMFATIDMQQQNRLIRMGVECLINFASGDEASAEELRRLGQSHGRHGLDVQPELYPHWVNTLIETVRQHDAQATPETEASWREVLRPGIYFMVSHY